MILREAFRNQNSIFLDPALELLEDKGPKRQAFFSLRDPIAELFAPGFLLFLNLNVSIAP